MVNVNVIEMDDPQPFVLVLSERIAEAKDHVRLYLEPNLQILLHLLYTRY